jgi:Pleckstrin homology domain
VSFAGLLGGASVRPIERLTRPRFGKLRLYGTLRVGKDKVSWQELECFLFAEMLICVKEKKMSVAQPTNQWDDGVLPKKTTRCTLKGSILIKKHLNEVTEAGTSKPSHVLQVVPSR